MIETILFDLSEVLIAGLIGIEQPIAAQLGIAEAQIISAFGGSLLRDLCCGKISEARYLDQIIADQQWNILAEELKQIIRANFHRPVRDMDAIVARLAPRYPLALLSDHAVEWIAYIRAIHPTLNHFQHQFFSYELKSTKREPSTFQTVLRSLQREPHQCLFIDDNEANVVVARELGMYGIVFTSAQELGQTLITQFGVIE